MFNTRVSVTDMKTIMKMEWWDEGLMKRCTERCRGVDGCGGGVEMWSEGWRGIDIRTAYKEDMWWVDEVEGWMKWLGVWDQRVDVV